MRRTVIRSGRDSKSKLAVPRGLFSRNLTAVAKHLSPDAMRSWTSLMKAVRHYWGVTFSRAHAIDKGLRDGTLDRAAYDAFMDRMLGTRVEDIVTGALHVNIKAVADATGRSVAKRKKSSRTQEYHYFMLPVRIGGRNYAAGFNARKTGSYKALVFDSFGMTHLEARDKVPEAETSRSSTQENPGIASPVIASGEITIGEILDRIKGDFVKHLPQRDNHEGRPSTPPLPNPKKLGDLIDPESDVSFSIGPDPFPSGSEARIEAATAEARTKVAAIDGETVKRTGRFWLSLHGGKGVAQFPELRGRTIDELTEEARATMPSLRARPFGMIGDAETILNEGDIISHNHPGGRGPSDSDLRYALNHPDVTMRIVARNEYGRTEIFQIRVKKTPGERERSIMLQAYKDACDDGGDTQDSRRRAFALIPERFADILNTTSITIP